MKCGSYDSMGGRTGKVDVENESYLIIDRKLPVEVGGHETVDIDYRHHIIRIYSDVPWKVHPMNKDSRTVPIEVLKES